MTEERIGEGGEEEAEGVRWRMVDLQRGGGKGGGGGG